MFRTELLVSPSITHQISLSSSIFTIGSCFSEMLGEKLITHKWNVLNSPFGTLYNPLSIAEVCEACILKKDVNEDLFVHQNEVWYSYLYHSSIADLTKDGLSQKIQQLNTKTYNYLNTVNTVIVTLGSAWVHKLINHNRVVANCHKSDNRLFEKRLLSVEEVVLALNHLTHLVRSINSSAQFIFTLSPVRHVKETLPLNAVSKSILRLALHQFIESNTYSFYFPAYELVLDDLRDYRFYAEDMIHPNVVAENYIWTKFIQTHFTESSTLFLKEWESILKSMAHKPFQTSTLVYQQFIQDMITQLKQIEIKYSINIQAELDTLQNKLI